jgi:hypothetical protein
MHQRRTETTDRAQEFVEVPAFQLEQVVGSSESAKAFIKDSILAGGPLGCLVVV